ncbi:glycosyltransferase family 4 protein [Thermoleophilia bacterium SCSIO 60948]|nr:glycosyltransferase family 4 protein [Thermoleophilia bacterium SCSIO 60948]
MKVGIVEVTPFGGLLHYAVQLGDALAARGNEVDLITPAGNELAGGHSGAARMRAVLHPSVKGSEQPKPGRLNFLRRRAGVAVGLVRAWVRAVFEARRGRYDVVLVTCDVQNIVAATAMRIALGLPRHARYVNLCHNARPFSRFDADSSYHDAAFSERLLADMYSRYDAILVHGERTKKMFAENWPHARIGIVPHGDERVFGEDAPPLPDERRILFFGAWRRVKGIPILLDAFDILSERMPDASITLAGYPHRQEVDVDAIEAWAERHGPRVEIIDRYLEIAEVEPVYARSMVAVTPYTAGFQSGVVHVAMTMGRPVVSSDVGDIGDVVIDGETGLLVAPGDPAALADALERVLSDRDLAERMGAAGRELALADASWERAAEIVEGELRATLEAQPAGGGAR